MSKKIYTKTGDSGKTTLLGGTKVSKNDWRLEAYGTVDELNSYLGLISYKMEGVRRIFQKRIEEFVEIQDNLFIIGSLLALDKESKDKFNLDEIQEQDIQILENSIDEMTHELPELKNFIIPGGSEITSLFHIARTICRRAERNSVLCTDYPLILKYLNRLSDYLFVTARFSTYKLGQQDKIWRKK